MSKRMESIITREISISTYTLDRYSRKLARLDYTMLFARANASSCGLHYTEKKER